MATITTATTNFQNTVVALIVQTIVSSLRSGLPWMPREVTTFDNHKVGANHEQWRHISYGDLPIDKTALTEGVPYPLANVQTLAIGYDQFGVIQMGKVVGVSDKAALENPHNLLAQIVEKAARQAVLTIDDVAKALWTTGVAGEKVFYTGGKTSRVTLTPTDVLTLDAVRRAVAYLTSKDVRRVGSSLNSDGQWTGGNFVLIASPEQLYDLKKESSAAGNSASYVDVVRYADSVQLLTGEIGMIAGVRVVESSRGIILTDAGAASAEVGRAIVAGVEALAIGDLMSLRASYVAPTPSAADLLGQAAYAGWSGFFGGVLIQGTPQQPRYAAIESGYTVL